VHEAVRILVEICDALAYAHERGIVHRDIKPDNVLLSGRHALVTDFGVAKALSEATGRQQLTTAGVALGTPTYMAPEQATADPGIDHRADIYALGVLGYELVAGRAPFIGRTAQEILAAQVTQRPEPLCAMRPSCPAALETVIMKCLEKRPADRWQTAEELLAHLEPLATPSGGITPTATRPVEAVAPRAEPAVRRRRIVPSVLLLVAAVTLALFLRRPPAELRLGRRVQLTLDPGLEIDPAVSPDGKLVAYTAGPLRQTRLYVRQVEGGSPVAITPADGGFARSPRWSPDGARLLFRSARGLEVVPALGGPVKLLLSVPRSEGAEGAWSPDGRSIAYARGDSVYLLPADGGTARGLARLADAHSCVWSADGRWLACVSGNRRFIGNEDFGNLAPSAVWAVPAGGGAPVEVTDNEGLNMSPAWLPRGRSLLYVSDRDGGRDVYQVELGRDGRRAHAAVRLTTGLNVSQVSVSADGRRLAYAVLSQTSNVWSVPVSAFGTSLVSHAQPVTRGSQVIESFDVSTDGRWLAFDSDRGGTPQLYRMPLGGGEVEQLTSGATAAFVPQFSPDGREIAYHSFIGGVRQIFVMPSEGGAPTQITSGSEGYWAPRWSPDGRAISIVRSPLTPDRETDVVTRDAGGRWGSPRTLVKGGSVGAWSPGGGAVATCTGGFGVPMAVEVVQVTGGARRAVLGGRDPLPDVTPIGPYVCPCAWSSDGGSIYFLGESTSDHTISVWRVPVAGGPLRPALRFDDLARPWHKSGLEVQGGRFYFTLGDYQSDIWMTEITGPA
jgi:Tol biopolymer transport system component